MSDVKSDDHVNIEWSIITDFIIIGTNMCCTTHGEELYQLGLDAEIDVQLEDKHIPMKVPIVLWVPTKDHTAPTLDQLTTSVAVLDNLVKRQKLTYIHCAHGHGRSPTLVAAYFISQGMGVEEAIETIRVKRPEIHLRDPQIEQLNTFAKLYA